MPVDLGVVRAQVPDPEPNEAKARAAVPAYELTDLGNSRRLVAAHGAGLRHVPEWGRWLAWTGTRWEVDLTGEAQRRAKEVAEAILDEARASRDDHLFRWGLRSESASALSAMLTVASTEPGIPVLVDELDRDPWLLAVANGTLDLRTGTLRPADRADLITKGSPVAFDPAATAPTFERFLAEILPDPEVREFLQRWAGYALTGDVREQVFLVWYGTGQNGKSTFKEVLLALLGDLAVPAAPKLLLETRHEAHPTQIADLHGRRLVVSHEVEDGLRLDEALVKELTGGDRLKARYMRQDYWSFAPTHKLLLACNHRPRVRGTDHGIWRRLRLVNFDVRVPDEKQDKALGAKLRAELPGILNWALAGCLAWQADGLQPPKAVIDATAEYRRESDLLGQFVEERCVVADGCQVRSAELYATYRTWCDENGLDHPLSQKALTRQLDERGFDRSENRAGQAIWLGIGLETAADGFARATP